MKITLAKHYGMCFGVRDALRATHDLAGKKEVTILGQLVHNPAVDRQLSMLGVQRGQLDADVSAPTEDVVITAHDTSNAGAGLERDTGSRTPPARSCTRRTMPCAGWSKPGISPS